MYTLNTIEKCLTIFIYTVLQIIMTWLLLLIFHSQKISPNYVRAFRHCLHTWKFKSFPSNRSQLTATSERNISRKYELSHVKTMKDTPTLNYSNKFVSESMIKKFSLMQNIYQKLTNCFHIFITTGIIKCYYGFVR